MRTLNFVLAVCMGTFIWAWPAAAADGAAEFEAKGIAALKLAQTQEDAIVPAALFFVKAADAYEKAKNDAKAQDMLGFLYWCRKKMTLQQVDQYLKGGDPDTLAAAQRIQQSEKTALAASDAQKYFDRASSYAIDHPGEHYLIAVRFFEIADRFKGTELSLKAQERSLAEMQLAMKNVTAPAIADAHTLPNAIKGATTNLMRLIKPAEHAVEGDWSLENGIVSNARTKTYSRLQLPYEPRLEYDLHIVYTRMTPGNDVGYFLVCGGRLVLLSTSCVNKYAGLQKIDGILLSEDANPTRTASGLKTGIENDLTIQVRAKTIRAYMHGQLFVDFNFAGHKFTLKNQWKLRDSRSLGLYCNDASAQFRVIEITEAPDAPAQPVFADDNVDPVQADPGQPGYRSKNRISSADFPTTAPKDAAKPSDAPPGSTALKSPAPTAAQRAESLAALREIFKDDFAKTAPKDKLEFSAKLVEQAGTVKDDPPGRHAMISQAALLAAQGGDLPRFFGLRDRLLSEFDLDAKEVAEFTKAGLSAAASKDPSAAKLVAAFKTLAEKPGDPAANAVVGAWNCFVQNDWEQGLPMLAKSNRAPLNALAQKDMAQTASKPGDAKAAAIQVELGDRWWEFAEKGDAGEKRGGMARALFWYGQALPSQAGLTKAKLEKRISVAQTGTGVAASPAKAEPDKNEPQAAGVLLSTLALGKKGVLSAAIYQLPKDPLSTETQLTIPAHTTIQEGTIALEGGANLNCTGTEAAPVVFRNVNFICNGLNEIRANHAIFDTCSFEIGENNPNAQQPLKLFMRESLLLKCEIGPSFGSKIGFEFIRNTFASMVLPRNDFIQADKASKRITIRGRVQNAILAGCLFLDCNVNQSLVCFSEQCNFADCRFVAAPFKVVDGSEMWTWAWISNCTGHANMEAQTKPINLVQMPAPFPAPSVPASTAEDVQTVRAKVDEIGRRYKWVSRDAVYTVSSVYGNDRPSPKLLTGEGSEYDTHNFHTNMDDAPDIVVNLGAPHFVSALEIENRKRDDVLSRADTLTIWTGDTENGPWTQQWRAKFPQPFFTAILPKPVSCQYVRIGLTKKECLHLNHVRIYESAK